MDNQRKQQLKLQYKQRTVIGGVYRIINVNNGKFLLSKSTNLQGAKNLFETGLVNGQTSFPRLRKDWDVYGKDAFEFEVLEEWEKGAEQSEQEFSNDVADLFSSWDEKLPKQSRY